MAIRTPTLMPDPSGRKRGLRSRQRDEVSTNGDEYERRMRTSVYAYFLSGVENDLLVRCARSEATTSSLSRRAAGGRLRRAGEAAARGGPRARVLAARAAPLLRHAPARRRRQHQGGVGAARPRLDRGHGRLRPRRRARQAQSGRPHPPPVLRRRARAAQAEAEGEAAQVKEKRYRPIRGRRAASARVIPELRREAEGPARYFGAHGLYRRISLSAGTSAVTAFCFSSFASPRVRLGGPMTTA